jgi:hypothetical protein
MRSQVRAMSAALLMLSVVPVSEQTPSTQQRNFCDLLTRIIEDQGNEFANLIDRRTPGEQIGDDTIYDSLVDLPDLRCDVVDDTLLKSVECSRRAETASQAAAVYGSLVPRVRSCTPKWTVKRPSDHPKGFVTSDGYTLITAWVFPARGYHLVMLTIEIEL